MKKSIIQLKKRVAARRGIAVSLCALVVLLAAFIPMIDGTLAYLKQGTPPIVNAFELGELKYVINYDSNLPAGSTDTVEGMPANNRDEKTVAASEWTFETGAPTRTGYQFLGWAEEADTDVLDSVYNEETGKYEVTVEYDEDGRYDPQTATTTKDVFAIWKQMDFKVSFDTQVEELANPDDMKVTYLEKYGKHAKNGELPTLVRTGYTHTGWSLDKEGTQSVTADSIVNSAADHVLYAQWRANKYIVKFDANSGTGTMTDQSFTYDVGANLKANAFTRDGYGFVGWSTDPKSTTEEYLDKQYVKNLTDGAEITLYAVWSASSIVVTFDTGYADAPATPTQKIVTYNEAYGALAQPPEIQGYTFLGWYTEKEGKGTLVNNETIVSNPASHTLYAHWTTPDIDLLLMYPGSGTNNFTSFDKHDYSFGEAITYTGQTKMGSWESFSIRMSNLEVGGTYQLKFDAAFSDRTCIRGYSNAENNDNADYPIGCTVDDESKYAENGTTGGSGMYDWKPTNANKSTDDFIIEFVATKDTMFWLWELSKIRNPGETYKPDWVLGVDNYEDSYFDLTLSDISLTLLKADIEFENTTLHNESKYHKLDEYADDSVQYTLEGGGGVYEKANIPITNLMTDKIYTVNFTIKTNANRQAGGAYHFGSYIGDIQSTSNEADFGSAILVWDGDSLVNGNENHEMKETTGSFSFKATTSTMYWIWDMLGIHNGSQDSYYIEAEIYENPSATPTQVSYVSGTSAVTFALSVPSLTITGPETIVPGEDCALVLSGGDFPDILQANVDGKLFLISLSGMDITDFAANLDATVKNDWLEADADGSYKLTIPAELVVEGTVITLSGYNANSLEETTLGTFAQ